MAWCYTTAITADCISVTQQTIMLPLCHYTHLTGNLSLQKSWIFLLLIPRREGQKREKNAGQRWNPHTGTHTLFNTFRKPPMNDILWGTVSVRPALPLQTLSASIHKCTWTVKGRWKLSLLWGLKKACGLSPGWNDAFPYLTHKEQGSCPEWETTWPFTKVVRNN